MYYLQSPPLQLPFVVLPFPHRSSSCAIAALPLIMLLFAKKPFSRCRIAVRHIAICRIAVRCIAVHRIAVRRITVALLLWSCLV
jgi:hypothetical protein